MAQSNYTKICRTKLWLYRILDVLCLCTPLLVYICVALGQEGLAVQKVALVGCLTIALILTVINVIAQKRLRCPIWIIIIGLYIVVQKLLLPLIIILAVTSVLDDLCFTPLIEYYRTKLIASKVDDDRAAEEAPRN